MGDKTLACFTEVNLVGNMNFSFAEKEDERRYGDSFAKNSVMCNELEDVGMSGSFSSYAVPCSIKGSARLGPQAACALSLNTVFPLIEPPGVLLFGKVRRPATVCGGG